MDTNVLVAGISGATAVTVAAISYALTKMREREVEWRKLKLEHYREYIAAMSGVAGVRSTDESQARYSDAVNSLLLVAPASVLKVLYKFQRAVSIRNSVKLSQEEHDIILAELMRAIRKDIHPRLSIDDDSVPFKVFEAPLIPSSSHNAGSGLREYS